MIYRQHLLNELERRRGDFRGFERVWRDEVESGARELRGLGVRGSEEIRVEAETKAKASNSAPGALPCAELEEQQSVAVSFKERWRTHEEARRWACAALGERVTFAADGSQILPGREISLPVAAVQVASFENPHTGDGMSYRKEARFEIVTPGELLDGAGGAGSPEAVVSFRRFQLETRTLRDFLESRRGWRERGERTPVAFFDGTLLISYTHPRTKIQGKYVDAALEMVKLSRETEVPLVGYIDRSYARDLVNLLETLKGAGERRMPSVYDAQLLRATPEAEETPPLLAMWGDRTIFCYCLREGLTEDFRGDDGEPLVGFVYLQTTLESAPARLDIPAWVYEAGLLEDVLDAVRGECVVGNGYPYALETADGAAVVTGRDRAEFLRIMQDFAEREDFGFHVSRKAVSKTRRR